MPGTPDPGGVPFIGLLVNFADELRAAGLAVGSGDVLVYCSAAGSLDPADLVDLYWAGRTTLVKRHDDIAKYDEVFRRFFLEITGPEEDVLTLMLRASAQAQGAGEPFRRGGAAGGKEARNRNFRRATESRAIQSPPPCVP